MLFSIVVPTYNRCAYLIEAIDSVLAQTYQDFEIVVVDDGSTDDTEKVVKERYANDLRVVYVKQKNSERGVARNHGTKLAKGDYVVYLDSDDWFYKNHLETLANAIAKHPEINFFATKNDFSEDGRIFRTDIKKIPGGIYGIEIVLKGNPLACNICVKRNNPTLILFQEHFFTMEDWIFLIQNLEKDRVLLIDAFTVTMREHSNRSMRSNRNVILKRREAMDFLLGRVKLPEKHQNIMMAYSFYFCAIHCYIDNASYRGLRYLMKAINLLGIKLEFVVLAIKLLVGPSFIAKIKKTRRAF